jgi:hypothetical protein
LVLLISLVVGTYLTLHEIDRARVKERYSVCSSSDPWIITDNQRRCRVRYLAIGADSELSCFVDRTVSWVANTRTIWTRFGDQACGQFHFTSSDYGRSCPGESHCEPGRSKTSCARRLCARLKRHTVRRPVDREALKRR